MSWITGLADKAENLLNKIDQNAATALLSPANSESNPKSRLLDEVITTSAKNDNLKRNLSTSSLSLAKSLTPKKYVKPDLSAAALERQHASSVSSSSRRSSISSKLDAAEEPVTVIDVESKKVEMYRDTTRSDYSIEQELAAFKIALTDVTAERNALKYELAHLQQDRSEIKIHELELLVSDLSSERDDLLSSVDELKQSSQAYIKSLSDLESSLAKTRQEYLDISERLSMQLKETENQTTALEQYRKKAQVTLQMKERIIEELKLAKNDSPSDKSNEKVLQFEVDTVKQENAHLQEEIQNLTKELGSMRQKQTQLEKQSQSSKQSESSVRIQLTAEQQRSLQLDCDLKLLNQEISAVREHMNTQRQTLTARLREKESELAKVRLQATQIAAVSDAETVESRLKSLTDSLVLKQSSVEKITAERNALRLQLEKVKDQLDHLVAQNDRPLRNQIINLNDTDDVKARLPQLMRANPFDNRVARRVKRAYSTLDSAGIRLGVFLRRYPLIRILVFAYIAILHMWVMFVLLSSTPPS